MIAHRIVIFWLALALAALARPAGAEAEPSRAEALVARGDAAWERRSEGRQGERAQPGPIAEAIAAYEAALEFEPGNLEAAWKLLRALYFQGDYTTDDRDEKRESYDRGRQVSERVFDRLASGRGGREELDRLAPQELVQRLADVPEAAPLYFWTAVNWGRWGEVFGKLAAARQGVAKRLREDSERVIALDPEYENAGGHRILGRLHSEAPRIPFVTGWVSRETAISELRRAREIAPEDPFNRLYLAEALLDHGPQASHPEALELLRGLAALEPRADNEVEDVGIRREARERLAEEGG